MESTVLCRFLSKPLGNCYRLKVCLEYNCQSLNSKLLKLEDDISINVMIYAYYYGANTFHKL